ncbi:MAG: NAD-dependent epimerase/dehydratase family protein, partial [Elusimicrobia bacterium]|nr:NAD-dependent epimerase/dehydratase family protein [Elusimicrobiota bacterium]
VFLAQKLAGKPFTVVGDGKQSRDFVFVKDVANAFCMAAESKLSGEIMNVGTGKPQSVNRLVELLEAPSVTYVPKRPGEPDLTHADASRITKLLGWKPKYSFEQGVKLILDNIDYWRQAPVWTPDTIAAATKDWFKYLGK